MEIEFDISHGIVLKHTNNISIQLIRIFANVLEISFPFFRFYGEYVSLFDYYSFHDYGNVETCITALDERGLRGINDRFVEFECVHSFGILSLNFCD